MSNVCPSSKSCQPYIQPKPPEPVAEPVSESKPQIAEDQVVAAQTVSFEAEVIESRPRFLLPEAKVTGRLAPESQWSAAPSMDAVAAGARKLGRGHTGAAVRQAQRMLRNSDKAINEDGYFGPKTQAAVLEFQKDNGIDEGGRIGPKTLSALQADYQARNGEFSQVHRSIRPQALRLADKTNSEAFTANLEDLTRSTQFRGLVAYQQSDILASIAAQKTSAARSAALQRQVSLADHGNLVQLAEIRSMVKG